MRLLMEWLADGALGIIEYEGLCSYLQTDHFGPLDGEDPPLMEWLPTQSTVRFPVPMGECRLDHFLQALGRQDTQALLGGTATITHLDTPDLVFHEDGPGVLYICVRNVFQIDDEADSIIYCNVGATIFPEGQLFSELPDDPPTTNEPVEPNGQHGIYEGDIETVRRFLRIHDEREEPLDEPLRSAWRSVHRGQYRERPRMAAYKIDREKEQAIEQRSLKLLALVLDDKQRQQVWTTNKFVMRAKNGKRYLITKRLHGNVYELDDKNRLVMNFCIYIEGVTLYDQMMAQKLLLENDPDHFFEVANASEVQRFPRMSRRTRDRFVQDAARVLEEAREAEPSPMQERFMAILDEARARPRERIPRPRFVRTLPV